ncbi:MAG: carboxypeptidase regulatory-like domain-containing protein [Pedobacter sp.]|nr:MAG: carboxypeptidase regulatory-like domain-containing protein [Pedobacter sp.]
MEFSGKIVNRKAEVVAEFSTTNKGMGSFYLLPQSGEVYTATFKINGKEQSVQLPSAKEQGTTLRIDALSKPDSIYVYLKASEEKRLEGYQLLAQKSNETIVSAPINLKNGISVLKLAKQVFPDGIIHFTLFSPQQQPINERQVFINHNQTIKLEIKADKNNYQLKDSASIEITATNEQGQPLSGTFAVTITDDGQVNQDVKENIISYFLAESDLKGNIEDASFYFKDKEPSTLLAMDNLLLTQGWVGYKWNEIMLQNSTPTFKPEKGNIVTGKVTGLFNKPVKNITVNMLSLGKEIFVIDTLTNDNGVFSFNDLPLTDSIAYNIKIKNEKGKTATGNIMVDEFKRATLPLQFTPIKPWYVNTDSTILNYFKLAENQIKIKDQQEMVRTGTLLNEVVIKGQLRKKEIVSKDAWDASFVMTINEEELKKMPQKMLRDLLKEKIPNFNIGNYWADMCGVKPSLHAFSSFRIGGSLISHVLIDKVNTHLAASGTQDNYQQSGISLTADKEYGPMVYQTNNYIFNALSASEIINITFYKGCNYYFLDITTRGGKGPWIAPTPGRYIYRPLPIYIAKEFYSPKYAVKDNSVQDYRSTIFWDANVVTDENGKAKISFYTADKPSTYTIKVEGTDLFGRFGYQGSRLKIVSKAESK